MAVSGDSPPVAKTSPYSWYVLFLLFLVYALNFIDRQVLTILAPHIRRDLGLSHADIGFLYGTAFGVFYALFGIPLGRLADSWHRVRLLTLGLALWSAMTAVSGFARTGLQLGAARIGVGIGEASAGPAAYSLLSDWFPRRRRATALALYSSGIYIGGGFSLFLGGLIVDRWNAAWPVAATAPLGLAGWQAAFLAVGLPGLLLALWVATLREPQRGQADGLIAPPSPAPFRGFFEELLTIVPPFTLIGAARNRTLASNLAALALIAASVWALLRIGEPPHQWLAVGIGAYAVWSWGSALRRRDAPAFALTIGTPAFLLVILAYGLNSFMAYAVAYLAPSHAAHAFAATSREAGLLIGAPAMVAGFLGVSLGGIVADRLRQRHAAGRLFVVLFGSVAPVPPLVLAFTTDQATLFYAMLPVCQFVSSAALGAAAAATQELVLPRMRGAATGAFFIGTTLIGLSLGPYLAGRIADQTGSIATGILWLTPSVPVALIAAIAACRLVPRAEATREARARAAGEPL